MNTCDKLQAFKPDGESETPLYIQLANKLSDAICAGRWQAREALPSERLLANTLGVSRVTARKAMDLLCERGMLSRLRGSGTYITPRHEQQVSRLTSFSENLSQRGFAAGSIWLERTIGVAAPVELLSLGLSSHISVVRLKRLRTVDGVVMAIESSTIPAAYLPDPHAVTDSLYDYLESRGTIPVRALQHIHAISANPEQARLADLDPGAAMLHIVRVSYLADGAAVELTHSYFRSDYYGYLAESYR